MDSQVKRLSGWAVFDLDGTLADSLTDIARALGRVLQNHGRSPVSLVETRDLIGNGPRTLIERAWIATGDPADHDLSHHLTLEYLREYRSNPRGGTLPFPGVQEGLRRLACLGWQMGVCTNKDGHTARALVEELGWGNWIKVVVSGEETVRKPDPLPLHLALRRLRAPAGRHLFVGDSEIDMQTARNASIEGVFLGHGYGNFGSISRDGMHFMRTATEMFSWMARSGPKPKLIPPLHDLQIRQRSPDFLIGPRAT